MGSYIQDPIISHDRKEQKKESIYTYMYNSYFVVYHKLKQYCKSTAIKKKKVLKGRRFTSWLEYDSG